MRDVVRRSGRGKVKKGWDDGEGNEKAAAGVKRCERSDGRPNKQERRDEKRSRAVEKGVA